MIRADHSTDSTATFRRVAPAWAWLRDNFKLPAVLSIAAVLSTAMVGYLGQRADLKAIRRADPTQRLERLEAKLEQLLEQRAADRQQLADVAAEVEAQREHWDRVQRLAELPPLPRHRRRADLSSGGSSVR